MSYTGNHLKYGEGLGPGQNVSDLNLPAFRF